MKITKKQFQKIEKYFPVQRGNVKITNCDFIDSILYTDENGCKWRALPKDKAYEGDKTRNLAGNYRHEPVVPPKKNRLDPLEYDVELYKRRNIKRGYFDGSKSSGKSLLDMINLIPCIYHLFNLPAF